MPPQSHVPQLDAMICQPPAAKQSKEKRKNAKVQVEPLQEKAMPSPSTVVGAALLLTTLQNDLDHAPLPVQRAHAKPKEAHQLKVSIRRATETVATSEATSEMRPEALQGDHCSHGSADIF